MFTDEELEFLEDELKANGVFVESVQYMLDTNIKSIMKLCSKIMMEEGDRCGGFTSDTNGNMVEYESHPDYDADRLDLAERIYVKLDRKLFHEKNRR